MLGLIDLGFAITLVPEDPTLYEPYAEALERAGIEIVDPVRETNVGAFLEEVGAGLDLVVLSRPETAARRLIPLRRAAPHAKVVFDTVDLASLRERRRAGVDISAADAGVAEATRALELALFGAADAVVAVTDVEREAITHEVPGARVFVWPTIHEVVSSVPPPSGRSGLLFVGNFLHLPNVDGVQWFLESVLPELRARGIRDVVQVVGELPSEELRSYERRDVRILGWVRDLDPLYASARVFVAPLRFGAGIKGKVAESLGRGLPVVTTSVGAEGFRAGAAHGLLVADDVGGFADAVAQLVQDDAVWSIASAGGLAEVEARFSRSAVAASLASSLRELGILTPPVSVDAGP